MMVMTSREKQSVKLAIPTFQFFEVAILQSRFAVASVACGCRRSYWVAHGRMPKQKIRWVKQATKWAPASYVKTPLIGVIIPVTHFQRHLLGPHDYGILKLAVCRCCVFLLLNKWGDYTKPWKIKMEPQKMNYWKMIFLFNWFIFRFYVSFQGWTYSRHHVLGLWWEDDWSDFWLREVVVYDDWVWL